MKIALGQINPTVGDIEGNTQKILTCIRRAGEVGVDLVLLPELCVTGYPPRDLVLKRSFVRANVEAVERIAAQTRGPTAVVGFVRPVETGKGKGLLNAAAVCAGGRVAAMHAKTLLPTYDVFDEVRYFDASSGPGVSVLECGGRSVRIGFTICEDLWSDDTYFARQLYPRDPASDLKEAEAQTIVNIGASPFSLGKPVRRNRLFAAKARQTGLAVVSVNQVGGNDDLIFDGSSAAFDGEGRVIAQAKQFAEDFLVVDLEGVGNRVEPLLEDVPSVYQALVLGTRDYVSKCGFEGVVIGVSGGIDSAVTAAVAVEALGAQRVHPVAMPSRYSSGHSLEDAGALCASLGLEMRIISIEDMHAAAERTLQPHFGGRGADITEENMQARARGTVLMSLSNKFGWLLLTTGNKSELAVGYCTLYGDMCGGLAVLSDVPKTMVYQLAEHINRRAGREIIPRRTISKPPSAELREDQTDQDSLPPYDVLDAILERYIEREQSAGEIIEAGFNERTVGEVIRMVDRNEYKRKQAAVGLKVTSRAFGTGRRMPIAARHSP